MRTRFALILYFRMAIRLHIILCQFFFLFEINEDIVQILLMLGVFFTQDITVEDLFCGALSGSDPSVFFSNYLFKLGA